MIRFASLGLLALAALCAASTLVVRLGGAPLAPWSGVTAGGEELIQQSLATALSRRPSTEVISAARRALAASPADDTPLVVGGAALAKTGNAAASDRAFETGYGRNPRNPLAQAWALDAFTRAGRFDDAVATADALLASFPPASAAVLDWLTRTAAEPRSHAALRRAVLKRPFWANQFVDRLVASSKDEAFWLDLCAHTPASQDRCLDRLLAAGRYEEAYLAWLSFEPRPQVRASPYDGAFRGMPGAAPFAWAVNKDVAEMKAGGGLEVIYDGRRSTQIASQLLLLGPGRYNLETLQSGDLKPRGASFRWRILCVTPAGAATDLLSAPVLQLNEKARDVTGGFEVPADACPAQSLRLDGVAGELPLWARATVGRVTISDARATDPVRAGASANTLAKSATP